MRPKRLYLKFYLDFQEVEAIDDLKKSFKSKDFSYDFAIITRPELKYIQNESEKNLGNNYPHEIGIVGTDLYELFGNLELDIKKVDIVYHFGGIGSKNATKELLKIIKPKLIHILKNKIKEEFALNLFFWKADTNEEDENVTFLVSNPLGHFYPNYINTEEVKKWGVLKQFRSDLILVCSESYKKTNNSENLNEFYFQILELRNDIEKNLDFYVDDMINKGILAFLTNTIGI